MNLVDEDAEDYNPASVEWVPGPWSRTAGDTGTAVDVKKRLEAIPPSLRQSASGVARLQVRARVPGTRPGRVSDVVLVVSL